MRVRGAEQQQRQLSPSIGKRAGERPLEERGAGRPAAPSAAPTTTPRRAEESSSAVQSVAAKLSSREEQRGDTTS